MHHVPYNCITIEFRQVFNPFFRNFIRSSSFSYKSFYKHHGNLFQIHFKQFPIFRTVNMKHRLFVFHQKSCRSYIFLIKCIIFLSRIGKVIQFFQYNLMQQIVDIFKMVIKRIPVHFRHFNHVFYRQMIHTFFI